MLRIRSTLRLTGALGLLLLTIGCPGEEPTDEEIEQLKAQLGIAALFVDDFDTFLAADPARIVGMLRVTFNLDLPSGFSGNLIGTIGTKEVSRTQITGPVNIRGGNPIDILTNDVAAQITANGITFTPTHMNGATTVKFQVVGTAQGQSLSGEDQRSITLANPDFHIAVVKSPGPILQVGGKSWVAGGVQVLGGVAAFGSTNADAVEVVAGHYGAQFGNQGAVVNVITRSSNPFGSPFDFTAQNLPGTSPAGGSHFWMREIRYGTNIFKPYETRYNLNGWCTDWDGDGWSDLTRPTSTSPKPAGCDHFGTLPNFAAKLNLQVGFAFSHRSINWDNDPPTYTGNPVKFIDALTTIGQTPYFPGKTLGFQANWLRHDYPLTGLVNTSSFSDAGVGLDVAAKWYAGPASSTNIFQAGNLINNLNGVLPSLWTTGFRLGYQRCDIGGNCRNLFLTTTSGNPYAANGALDPTPGDDTEAIAYLDNSGPQATWSGTLDGATSRVANNGFFWTLNYNDQESGIGANAVIGHAFRTSAAADCRLGTGAGCDEVVLGGSATTYTLPFSAIEHGEGYYMTGFAVLNRSGLTSPYWDRRSLYDATVPTVANVTGPTGALSGSSSYSYGATLFDNIDGDAFQGGAYFNTLPVSFFPSGRFHVPQYTWKGDGFWGTLNTSVPTTANVPLISSLQFAGTNGSLVGAPIYPLTHYYTRGGDVAGGWGNHYYYDYLAGAATIPTSAPITNVTTITTDPIPTQICTEATGCTGGISDQFTAGFRARTATSMTTAPFSEVYFGGIWGGINRLLGVATTATSQAVGGETEWIYNATVKASEQPVPRPAGSLIYYIVARMPGGRGAHPQLRTANMVNPIVSAAAPRATAVAAVRDEEPSPPRR